MHVEHHDLHKEFPEMNDVINVLRQGNPLFARLYSTYHRLTGKVEDLEEHDMPVVLHVHDEGATLVPDDPFSPGLAEMVDIMSTPVDWAPGLLLGADGFEGQFYHK